MFLGVSDNHTLLTRANLAFWTQVPNMGTVIAVTAMRDGTLLGVGTENDLWTRANLTSPWIAVPDSGTVLDVAVMPNGTILGVGTERDLWTRTTLTGPWIAVPNSGDVIAVAVMADGTILGVHSARDGDQTVTKLRMREWLEAPWVDVPNSEGVINVAVLGDGTILGVDPQNNLQIRSTLDSPWVTVADSGTVIAATQLPSGVIVGVGTENDLWARPRLSSRWVQVPTSGTVIAATQLPDGTILGVGLENDLWTRATLTAPWIPVPGSGTVLDVAVMSDGTLLGVGTGKNLWTRSTLTSPWDEVQDSGDVIAVTVLPDNTILGVGTENDLWTRATLTSNWVPVNDSKSVISVAVMSDGTILGVGTGNDLWTRATLTSPWEPVPGSENLLNVSVMADGTVLGVGIANDLWTVSELPASWIEVPDSGTVISLAVMRDGTLLGVGTGNDLWTRKTVTSPWQQVPNSGAVKDVAMLPDGTILGVGMDNDLQTRATLDSAWQEVPASGTIISVTVLADGTILGVGTDNDLWTRATLTSEWEAVAESGTVRSVTCLPDGTILGVGMDDDLWTRASVTSPWTPVPGGGSSIRVAVLPDEDTQPLAADWLLQYTSRTPADSAGDGRPWGDGTAMAARAEARGMPWDPGCLVTPLVGGFATLGAIRDAFEAGICDAEAQAACGIPPGQRGHVYITDWLFNGLRDLSELNPWGGTPWNPATKVAQDQTALGLVLRMMAAGIGVRLLLWTPTTAQAQFGFTPWTNEHWSIAAAVQDYNATLETMWSLDEPLGVVALDLRTGAPASASLHQKAVVVRVGSVNVAFCGGVDLAFTRRDFGRGRTAEIGTGDWQSGDTMPVPAQGWPKQDPPPVGGYPSYPYLGGDTPFPNELPEEDVYGTGPRHWHDQHLKLEGPVVGSLEQQFAERWVINTPRTSVFDRTSRWLGFDNQVILTSSQAISGGMVIPLPPVVPVPPAGNAAVQIWRTIPLRAERTVAPFVRGEFTVLAGVAHAVSQAETLITIWDQYFWSVPLANLLAERLQAVPELRLLIVLPPYGTNDPANEMAYRLRAIQQTLWQQLDDNGRARVLAADMWAPSADVGVYVHAKVQTYDDALLVCGSANMNRRSFECDAELDCAVLDRRTVRAHLANLYACVAGTVWTDFADGWLTRYWSAVAAIRSGTLVDDPFFVANVLDPRTPNGVPIPYNGNMPDFLMDPSSIGPSVDTGTCSLSCPGDPKAPGRLDEVTFLLERCHQDDYWPWRVAGIGPEAPAAEVRAVERLSE